MNHIEEYLRICRDEKRLSPRTLLLYERDLVTLSQLGTIEAVQEHLRKLAPSTFERKLVIWRSFTKTLNMQSDLASHLASVQLPKLRKRKPNFLSRLETEKIRSEILNIPIADQLFFELGLSMGLRISEIRSIRKSNFQEGWLKLIRKGDHEEILPISDEVKALIDRIEDEEIFKKHYHSYYKLVKKIAKRAGISKRISPHSLRHTFATEKARSGHSLESIKHFLGHSNLTTTERYLHVIPEYLRSVVQKGELR